MKKSFRIIISCILVASSVAVFVLCAPLMTPPVNWTLLIPGSLVGVGLLYIAWQVGAGATWRDVTDFITDVWR